MSNIMNTKKYVLAVLALAAVFSFGRSAQAAANYHVSYYSNSPAPVSSSSGDASTAFYGQSGSSSAGSSSSVNAAAPIITSVTPNAIALGTLTDGLEISITGQNFIPGSIARFNSSDRTTIYEGSNNLLMDLTNDDLAGNGQYLITVYNPGTNGGYSNSAVFTIGASPTGTVQNGNGAAVTTAAATAVANPAAAANNSNLSATAIRSFLPATLLQWFVFTILILLAIILWRRYYLAEKERQEKAKHDGHSAPLKHA